MSPTKANSKRKADERAFMAKVVISLRLSGTSVCTG